MLLISIISIIISSRSIYLFISSIMVSIISSIRKNVSLKKWLGIEIIATSVTQQLRIFSMALPTDVEQLKTTDH